MTVIFRNREFSIGSFLIGYLKLSYDEIFSIFGAPNTLCTDDYKTDWEWVFEIEGHLITIYNYKDGSNYTGNKDIKPNDIKMWHVGGKSIDGINILQKTIDELTNQKYKDKKILWIA